MRFTDRTQVKKGMDVFYVHCFPNQQMSSFIYQYRLTEDPVLHNIGSYFVKGLHIEIKPAVSSINFDLATGKWIEQASYMSGQSRSFSLLDAGIQQIPKYNDHALFDDFDEAKQYVVQIMGFVGSQLVGTLSIGSTGTWTTHQTDPPPPITPVDDYDRAMRGI